jgi:hypothetical protein
MAKLSKVRLKLLLLMKSNADLRGGEEGLGGQCYKSQSPYLKTKRRSSRFLNIISTSMMSIL